MSTNTEELLKSFDLLPDSEKRQVASEIIRRTLVHRNVNLDESRLAELYEQFAADDSDLAEQGVDDYGRGLAIEDGQ